MDDVPDVLHRPTAGLGSSWVPLAHSGWSVNSTQNQPNDGHGSYYGWENYLHTYWVMGQYYVNDYAGDITAEDLNLSNAFPIWYLIDPLRWDHDSSAPLKGKGKIMQNVSSSATTQRLHPTAMRLTARPSTLGVRNALLVFGSALGFILGASSQAVAQAQSQAQPPKCRRLAADQRRR